MNCLSTSFFDCWWISNIGLGTDRSGCCAAGAVVALTPVTHSGNRCRASCVQGSEGARGDRDTVFAEPT